MTVILALSLMIILCQMIGMSRRGIGTTWVAVVGSLSSAIAIAAITLTIMPSCTH